MGDIILYEGTNELNVQLPPIEIVGEPKLISVDYPEQIDVGISGPDVWAGQTVFLPYTSGVMYSFGLTVWSDYYAHRIQLERAEYLAADIYDELGAKGLSPGEKYIRFPESGQYIHYGMGVESYSEPARIVYMPYGIYPVRSFASVYHVEVGYHLGKPYTKRTKISDLWAEDVGTVEIVMPVGDWVWPTGHNDPSGSWSMEWQAYDGDLDTHTNSGNDLNEWSGFLEFTFDPPIMSDKARFNADFLPGLNDEIDLDVHRDGVWIDVYQGSFASRTWIETSFPQGSVDKARIRMRHTTKPGFAVEWLYEFQLWSF